jgi:hypothetical protein
MRSTREVRSFIAHFIRQEIQIIILRILYFLLYFSFVYHISTFYIKPVFI